MNYTINEVVKNQDFRQYPNFRITNKKGDLLYSGLIKDTPKVILDRMLYSSSFNNNTMYITVKEL